MCAGIRDAANLAWKLRDVIAERADASLLDTYQSERSPHAREFIELAIRLGGVINTKAVEVGLSAGEARENAPVKLEVRKPLLGSGLEIGNLALARQLAPQFSFGNGQRSDDRTGYTNVLLVEKAAALPEHVRAALVQAGTEVLSGEDAADLPHWLREHGIQAALARPDRYLRGTARSEAELELLVEAVCSPATMPTAA
jgi:3-(3-hydroxy-phenyl)propionate hydroxylase